MLKDDIGSVQKILPIIDSLTKAGVKERHWEMIESVLSSNFDFMAVNLKDLLKFKIDLNYPKIEEITENAQKEYAIENALFKMEKDWDSVEMQTVLWKNGIQVFQNNNLEETQSILED